MTSMANPKSVNDQSEYSAVCMAPMRLSAHPTTSGHAWDDRQSPLGPGLGHKSTHHTALGILEETRMKLIVLAYGLLLCLSCPTDVWVPVPSRWSLRPSTGTPPITDHPPGGRSRQQQSLCSIPTPLMSHLIKRAGRWGSCSMVQYQAVNSGTTWECVFLMPPCFWQSGQNLGGRREVILWSAGRAPFVPACTKEVRRCHPGGAALPEQICGLQILHQVSAESPLKKSSPRQTGRGQETFPQLGLLSGTPKSPLYYLAKRNIQIKFLSG